MQIHSTDLQRSDDLLTSMSVCPLAQYPAAGPEGEDAEGGGGGDEGYAELYGGRKSSRLRTQQRCGQSNSGSTK